MVHQVILIYNLYVTIILFQDILILHRINKIFCLYSVFAISGLLRSFEPDFYLSILGCGVPLMPAFGKVDYCRIGADMGLRWKVPFFSNREFISTYHTLGNSIFRRQLDGRAFLNDPDVFLLRDENIHCTFEQRKIIATVNKVFGSVLFTSDNVGKYSDEQMSVLLDTFKKSKIDVKSAEFLNENKRIMKFVYTQDGIEHTFKFNIDKGTIV